MDKLSKHKECFRNLKRYRKYQVNDTFFDVIDCQEKAYFLGLLYADGHNDTSKYHCLRLSLQTRDIKLLEDLNKLLDSTIPIRIDNHGVSPQAVLRVTNKYLTDRLETLGCTPKKSLTLTFPSWLSPALVPHFIRGYFDGDGSVGKNTISITSTDSFCSTIKILIKNILKINSSTRLAGKEGNLVTKELVISGGKQVRKFLRWIYKDSTIHLERKYSRYKKHLIYEEYIEKKVLPRSIKSVELKKLLNNIIEN